MAKNVILFDLDGTLTDSGPGIMNSVAYALEQYGIEPEPALLQRFVGPPPWDAFMEYCGFSRAQAEEAVPFFRRYYREKGLFENQLYPGIPSLLERLGAAGMTLAVATSKPTVFARQVLEYFDIHRPFAFVGGSEESGHRSGKADVIAWTLEHLGSPDPAAVMMVGDTKYDVIGARQMGLECVGVLYGYGGEGELEAAGADYLVADVRELEALLLGLPAAIGQSL